MGVHHRRAEIPVPQDFLDGLNVVAVFEKLGRKKAPSPVGAMKLPNLFRGTALVAPDPCQGTPAMGIPGFC